MMSKFIVNAWQSSTSEPLTIVSKNAPNQRVQKSSLSLESCRNTGELGEAKMLKYYWAGCVSFIHAVGICVFMISCRLEEDPLKPSKGMYAGGDRRQFSSAGWDQHIRTTACQSGDYSGDPTSASRQLWQDTLPQKPQFSLHLVIGTILSAHLNRIQFHTCKSSQIWLRAEDRIQSCLILNKMSFTVAMNERKHCWDGQRSHYKNSKSKASALCWHSFKEVTVFSLYNLTRIISRSPY